MNIIEEAKQAIIKHNKELNRLAVEVGKAADLLAEINKNGLPN